MKRALHILILAISILAAVSCNKEEMKYSGTYKDVFIYYGVGFNNLSSSLKTNLKELSAGQLPALSADRAIVAYIHSTATSGDYTTENSPRLIQYYTKNGVVVADTVKTYSASTVSASSQTLRQVLSDVNSLYPSESYGFLLSSHGTGWLPSQVVYYKNYSLLSADADEESDNTPLPRGFGRRQWSPDPTLPETKTISAQYYKSSSNTSEIELDDFADTFPMKMKYIILDACLCGGVEVAYQLKDVCDYLIASPTETLTSGLVRYTDLPARLFSGSKPDLEGICKDFYDYTMSRSGDYQSGTVTLVDCSKLQSLASFCKTFYGNHRDEVDSVDRGSVQKYFYDSKAWFYDLRDLIAHSGASGTELGELDTILSSCIPYHAETDTFFSLSLDRCCGLSTYIPYASQTQVNDHYKSLSWNSATDYLE